MRRIIQFAAVLTISFGSLAYIGLYSHETSALAMDGDGLDQNQIRASQVITVYMPTIFREERAIASEAYDDPNCQPSPAKVAFAIRFQYENEAGDFPLNAPPPVLVELDFDNSSINKSFTTTPVAFNDNNLIWVVVGICVTFNDATGAQATVSIPSLGSNKKITYLSRP